MRADNKKLELISSLTTGITNCSLYSVNHPIVRSLSEKAAGIINDLLGQEESLDIMVIDNELVFRKEPLREKSLHINNFVKRIRRKGIDKLVFKKGVKTEEIVKMVSDIADPSGVVSQYPHISTGLIEVKFGDSSLDGLSMDELEKFKNEQEDKLKGVYSGISRFKKLDIAGLEDIVVNFISTFQKESNILNIMTPIKSYSSYTYTHATNVAVVAVFLAESIGIKGDYLHDIGISALLHDVGKMFIPGYILEKKGKLDEKEWEEIKKHTTYGAKYLMSIDTAPKIALPAALEHHMRYDGTGYPATKFLKRKQHLCSQIMSIADVFDALRSKRPYKQDMEVVDILSFLRKDAGTAFNPVLVDVFIRNLSQTISI